MQTLEIAVFEATDPDRFVGRQARLHAQLGEAFDGYVGSLGLRSLSEPEVFADLVLWTTDEAARAAAAALPEREELAWFHHELGPIRFFGHLRPSLGLEGLTALAAAPVVELVLVRPTDPARFSAAHADLHDEHLAAADSVVGHVRLLPDETGLTGDLNGWTSADAMQAMAPAMMERPELAPVFDPGNEMLLFMPFTTNVAP